MRKLILSVLILFPVLSFAQDQSKWDLGTVLDTYISSTNADTSITFTTRDVMTFNFFLGDTSSGGDSSQVEFFFDFCTDPTTLEDWIIEDSTTISDDSTWTRYILTEFAVSSFPYMRVRAVGRADNKKDSSVQVKARKSFWYRRRW